MSFIHELACDCHVHVIGPRERYRMLERRPYTPAEADLHALRQHMSRLSLGRAVIVQPSVYGTDNRCLIDCMDAVPGIFRGVAVLDREVTDDQLAAMTVKGIIGLRINLESTGGGNMAQAIDAIRYWASRLAGTGWHIQIYAGYQIISDMLAQLGVLPITLVIDHFGLIPPGIALDQLRASQLYRRLASGDVYIKLSGAYRVGATVDADRISGLAHALLAANLERVVWASDWPHTNREPGKLATQISAYRDVSPDLLARERSQWLSTDDIAYKVLVENPARLYRFGYLADPGKNG
jgi:predicted TIM-barrel fold metal-dependent hydrolase